MQLASRLLCGLVMASAAAAQSPAWSLRSITSAPPARSRHAIAYDGQRGVTVLFGGATTAPIPVLGDTWEWNGAVWTERSSFNVPPPRAYHSIAYDSQRHRAVLFGGWAGGSTLLADTWEWDGFNWIPVSSTQSPPERAGAALAYDSARGRTVLFGGQGAAVLGDTWEWNGTDWLPVNAPAPAARYGHAMVYDAQRGRTLLFGGDSGNGTRNDTWEWNGTSWTERVSPVLPPARAFHGMAYDGAHNRTVMFGGHGATWLDDTWEWNGTQWALQAAVSRPLPRETAMAFASNRGRIVLFGGDDASGQNLADTWERGDPLLPAATRSFGTGCGQPALVISSTGRPLLGTTQFTNVSNVPGTAFMAVGLSMAAIGPLLLPLALDGFGMPGCWLYQDCVDLAEPCTALSPGAARHSIVVANNVDLLGLRVYLQAWAPAPGTNQAGLIASNALELTVGNQ
jgi:hypothetical protein